MKLKDYIREEGLEDEPMGVALFTALTSQRVFLDGPEDLRIAFQSADLNEILRQIGVLKNDGLETIKDRIKMALRRTRNRVLRDHPQLIEGNEAIINALRDEGEIDESDIPDLAKRRLGQRPSTEAESRAIMLDSEIEMIRDTLRALLEWLDDK